MRNLYFEFFKHFRLTRHRHTPVRLLTFSYLLILGFTLSVSAQITIENSVFPVVDDTLHFALGNQPGAINQVFTPPGGDQQWDLSNLQPTQFWNQVMKNPQIGAASASFPAASILFNPENSSNQIYWQVTSNQVNDLGYYGMDELGLGLNLLFIKSPPLEQSWAPINFFDFIRRFVTLMYLYCMIRPAKFRRKKLMINSGKTNVIKEKTETVRKLIKMGLSDD